MDNNKPRAHFVPPYFLDPVHPISVTLIGAGGNGSRMLSCLARINAGLIGLGGKGLYVTVYDGDTVDTPNIGRQLFSPSELGQNKAVALVSRFNRFFGTAWSAVPEFFTETSHAGNIVITAVDNIKARLTVEKVFTSQGGHEEFRPYYWLDLGNAQSTGQCFLGSSQVNQPASPVYETVERLPLVTEEIDFSSVNEADSGPSCSMREALAKQDLFINSTLCELAGSLLWSLLKDNAVDNRGFYLNLETLRVVPVKV